MVYKVENIQSELYDDKLLCTAYNNMSTNRQQRADRYKHIEDKRLCVFSDMLLRQMLNESGVQSPEFCKAQNGKPILRNSNIHFNLSHTKGHIACVIDHSPVGIDIEIYRKISAKLVKRICTQEELGFVYACSQSTEDTETIKRFFMVWTAKEAYLKYTGEGLSGGLQQISVATEKGMKDKLTEKAYLISVAESNYALSLVTENPKNK